MVYWWTVTFGTQPAYESNRPPSVPAPYFPLNGTIRQMLVGEILAEYCRCLLKGRTVIENVNTFGFL